jgi:metal-sulfur cluster biosynthetic enzyme
MIQWSRLTKWKSTVSFLRWKVFTWLQASVSCLLSYV